MRVLLFLLASFAGLAHGMLEAREEGSPRGRMRLSAAGAPERRSYAAGASDLHPPSFDTGDVYAENPVDT